MEQWPDEAQRRAWWSDGGRRRDTCQVVSASFCTTTGVLRRALAVPGGWHDGRRALCRDQGQLLRPARVDPVGRSRDAPMTAASRPVVSAPALVARTRILGRAAALDCARAAMEESGRRRRVNLPVRHGAPDVAASPEHRWGSHRVSRISGLTIPAARRRVGSGRRLPGWTCCNETGRCTATMPASRRCFTQFGTGSARAPVGAERAAIPARAVNGLAALQARAGTGVQGRRQGQPSPHRHPASNSANCLSALGRPL